MAIGKTSEDVVNDCAIPRLDKTEALSYELPLCSSPNLTPLMNEFKELSAFHLNIGFPSENSTQKSSRQLAIVRQLKSSSSHIRCI